MALACFYCTDEDSDLKRECFIPLLRNFLFSFNKDVISTCIRCLQNGDDVSEEIIHISDNEGAKYLVPITLLSKDRKFGINFGMDEDTEIAIYCYIALYSESVEEKTYYLERMVECSVEEDEAKFCKYYRNKYFEQRERIKNAEFQEVLMDCIAAECKILDNYEDVRFKISGNGLKRLDIIRGLARRGVESAFVEFFNYYLSAHLIQSYSEMIELADECIRNDGNADFIVGEESSIKRSIDESIPDFLLWYKYAGEHGDILQKFKYANCLINSNGFQDVRKGCAIFLDEKREDYLKKQVRELLNGGNICQVILLSDALISFDCFENSILDSPPWFIDCLTKKDIWFFSDIENITGEEIYELIDCDEKRFLGAMCILADRGFDTSSMEDFIDKYFYDFEDLNPDFSFYVLQE